MNSQDGHREVGRSVWEKRDRDMGVCSSLGNGPVLVLFWVFWWM
jgi:hypothetical protein